MYSVHVHTMYGAHVCTCVYTVMHVYVAVPRQESMSPARANAVLSRYCDRFFWISLGCRAHAVLSAYLLDSIGGYSLPVPIAS